MNPMLIPMTSISSSGAGSRAGAERTHRRRGPGSEWARMGGYVHCGHSADHLEELVMADRVLQQEELVIDAPADACLAVALDVERYPEWATDIKEATVLSRDGQGRAELVRFRVAGMGHSTSYTLRYDYSGAPSKLAWVLEKGDVTSKLDGHYTFDQLDGDPARTDVCYQLEVELIIPLPTFVKRRAEVKIMHTALRDLRARVEATLPS